MKKWPNVVEFAFHFRLFTPGLYWGGRWTVWAKSLPNLRQNDQIHVTDCCHIVLMRNLLPPPLSSFGICAGFLFVFLSLLSLQSALTSHSVQDIWELDKPQTLGNESFIQKFFKLWEVWHHVRNKAISRAILLSPSDWFARDAEVSKSGDDRLGKLAPVLISTLLNSLCRLEGQIFRGNWNS